MIGWGIPSETAVFPYAHFRRGLVLSIGALAATLPVRAQMVVASAGHLNDTGHAEATYTWRLNYLQQIVPGWGASLGWMNEGHLPDHHRDGPVLEAWRYWQLGNRPGHLALGLGLYRPFDTITGPDGSFQDRHGCRGVASAALGRPLDADRRWLAAVQADRTFGGWAPQTQSVSLGLGYRLGQAFRLEGEAGGGAGGSEPLLPQTLNLYYGTTVLNSFQSETAPAYQIEYRRTLTSYWEWSLAYSDEGSPGVIEREGIVAQGWFGGWFLDQKLQLSVGWGPYANRFKETGDGGATWDTSYRMAMRITLGAAWRLGRSLLARAAWNRTVTSFNRDSDVIVGGVGYGW